MMEFPPYDFEALNETDIREEIIAPLLRSLGYRSGTENNVIREQPLNYAKSFLGRKKGSDPVLRGRADYICEVQQQVRWVIEAKSPDAALDREVEEQSWSYANHPEIRAVYFCLTNGREFKIFQTNRGPEAPAIFHSRYENLEKALSTIHNILSPVAILRDYSAQAIDRGEPIGPGLRSIVRVTNGSITFHKNTLGFQPLIGLTMAIAEGSLERNKEGRLEVYVETMVPFQSLQKLNERLGLHSLRLKSDDLSLSIDPAYPSRFASTTSHILPKGETVLDLTTWRELPFPMNMNVETQTIAAGYLGGHVFQGDFQALLLYKEIGLRVGLEGSFRLHLS
jgi:hypothetical protein